MPLKTAPTVVRSLGTAQIDPTGQYRYSLSRVWDEDNHWRCLWILLNPSTADASNDDPTVRKCVGFSKLWKCGGMTVVNLYALRATDPRKLLAAPDPVGPENDNVLDSEIRKDGLRIAAWGIHAEPMREDAVLGKISVWGFKCLGVTKDGHPKHPLYVPYNQALESLFERRYSRREG